MCGMAAVSEFAAITGSYSDLTLKVMGIQESVWNFDNTKSLAAQRQLSLK